MVRYGQNVMLLRNVPVYQAVLNLCGRADDITVMKGRATQFREQLGWDKEMGLQIEQSLLMQIAFYAEELDLAAENAKKLQSLGSKRSFLSCLYFYQVRGDA